MIFYSMTKFKWTPRKRRAAYMLACEPKRYNEIAAELNITVRHFGTTGSTQNLTGKWGNCQLEKTD